MKRLEINIFIRILLIILNFFIFIILGLVNLYSEIIVMHGDPPPNDLEIKFYKKTILLFIISIAWGILFIVFTKNKARKT